MGLLSFFRRRTNAADTPTRSVDSTDDIAQARTRARRRLLGAAVLVMAGVIGFPLVFETQPRPVPVDIPIEIPRKDAAPTLTMPPARVVSGKASTPLVASPRDETPASPPAEGPREGAAPASAPAEKPAPEPKKAVAEPARTTPAPAPDAARAKALLEGKAEAKAEPKPKPAAKPASEPKPEPAREGGRFVVQAGAFADENAAREMRAKLERLGLKSYTQVVETSTGSRTRVRAGPYATRDEAERALAKVKAAGVGGVVLTL
ncbi:SPOR domain-containing protein [Piscinibacter sp.]|uniref:SPOR domain-containing protein n=1 Tax=Piscinibacter sp. TaxID=1903157 RepID=UPI0035AFE7BA